jgi:hypothetical protein
MVKSVCIVPQSVNGHDGIFITPDDDSHIPADFVRRL